MRHRVVFETLCHLVWLDQLSFDAATGCMSLIADSHKVLHTVFNQLQTAALLCSLLKTLIQEGTEEDPIFDMQLQAKYFKESAAFFTRILPQVQPFILLLVKPLLVDGKICGWICKTVVL